MLPCGTVTFLFTDIADSPRLLVFTRAASKSLGGLGIGPLLPQTPCHKPCESVPSVPSVCYVLTLTELWVITMPVAPARSEGQLPRIAVRHPMIPYHR